MKESNGDPTLEFRLDKIEDLTPPAKSYLFSAHKAQEPVARLDITYSPTDEHRPEPFTFAGVTEEAYRGQGIMGQLIRYANKYCKEELGSPLFSGTWNNDEGIRVWEKLADEGLVEEFMEEDEMERRWKFS